MQVKHAVVVITGGAQGLGRAIADKFDAHGAQVVVVDRNPDALEQLPSSYFKVRADVTNVADVNDMTDTIVEKFGRIHVLVNNAGVIMSEPLVQFSDTGISLHGYDKFKSCLDINLNSVFLVSTKVIERMVSTRTRGCVINMSSISATGNAGQTAYSAAKAAVEAMTQTWSKELGRFGIRVNAVAPGFIDTPSTIAALSADTVSYIKSQTPLKRLGQTENVADLILSLVENDFINGAVMRVDGGLRF